MALSGHGQPPLITSAMGVKPTFLRNISLTDACGDVCFSLEVLTPR
jgi:hypothetical protein